MHAADPLLQFARRRGLVRDGEALPGDVELARRVARDCRMEFVSLAMGDDAAADARALVPAVFARAHTVLALACTPDSLRVAVADPGAVEVCDRLAELTGRSVESVLALRSEIEASIAEHYASPPVAVAVNEAAPGGAVELAEQLITTAAAQGASDIHIEPLRDRLRVRCRIDGDLRELDSPGKQWQLPLVSRLKIIANLDIAERRLPQDGRAHLHVGGAPLDLRVSSVPTVHGESMVLRLLDRRQARTGLDELGFLPDQATTFARLLHAPDGLTLITGPTGSGKTTTLYSSLHHLNDAAHKIITVEDPVEYRLPGINQVQVNRAAGLTFASAVRAMLRQSPNVIMIGEIRDPETAESAVNAALTGHQVFSTLHTNDAPSAVDRLADLGVKRYLIASSLRAVVAQRLVRRVCPQCRVAGAPTALEQALVGPAAAADLATVWHGQGCDHCRGTGYRGRVGLFELMELDEALRGMIYDNITVGRLRQQARAAGMRSLRDDGLRKVLAGLTTIEEVVSATVSDQV